MCIQSREKHLFVELVLLQSLVTQLQLQKSRLIDQNQYYISQIQTLKTCLLQKRRFSNTKGKANQLLQFLLLLQVRRRFRLAPRSLDSVKAASRGSWNSTPVDTHSIRELDVFSVIIEALRFRQLLQKSEASRLVLYKRMRNLKNVLFLVSGHRSRLSQLILSQRTARFSHAQYLIMKRMNRMLIKQHKEERIRLEGASEWASQQLIIQLLKFRKMLLDSYRTSTRGGINSKTLSPLYQPANSELETIRLSLAELQIEKRSQVAALASVLKELSLLKPAPVAGQPVKELIIALALSLKALREQRRCSVMLRKAL